jgi:hypothetical protein
MPIKVAVQYEAWTVFTGIGDLNPTQGVDICIVCVYSVVVSFCV